MVRSNAAGRGTQPTSGNVRSACSSADACDTGGSGVFRDLRRERIGSGSSSVGGDSGSGLALVR